MSAVFDQPDYKAALRALMEDRRAKFGRAFSFQGLATACRVQKTYISRVMNADAHLSCDQLYQASDYLGIKGSERRYLALLLEHERSVVQARRREIKIQLESLRRDHLKTKNHLLAESIEAGSEDLVEYYLDADHQIVHQLLAIPAYQQDIEKVKRRVGLDSERLSRILMRLERLHFIKSQSSGYVVTKERLHLSPDAAIYRHARRAIKLASLAKQEPASGDGLALNVFFSADEKTRRRIQERFMQFLKEAEDLVRDAPSEEVYYLSFDFFAWLS